METPPCCSWRRPQMRSLAEPSSANSSSHREAPPVGASPRPTCSLCEEEEEQREQREESGGVGDQLTRRCRRCR